MDDESNYQEIFLPNRTGLYFDHDKKRIILKQNTTNVIEVQDYVKCLLNRILPITLKDTECLSIESKREQSSPSPIKKDESTSSRDTQPSTSVYENTVRSHVMTRRQFHTWSNPDASYRDNKRTPRCDHTSKQSSVVDSVGINNINNKHSLRVNGKFVCQAYYDSYHDRDTIGLENLTICPYARKLKRKRKPKRKLNKGTNKNRRRTHKRVKRTVNIYSNAMATSKAAVCGTSGENAGLKTAPDNGNAEENMNSEPKPGCSKDLLKKTSKDLPNSDETQNSRVTRSSKKISNDNAEVLASLVDYESTISNSSSLV